jgi:deoxyribonuclease-1-like protein
MIKVFRVIGAVNHSSQKRFILLLLLFWTIAGFAQLSVCSWNIQNLGKSKSDSELELIAAAIQGFDLIALQEVVAGNGGAQAVARLVSILNTKGNKWDYVISDPTTSHNKSSRERYAFIWKPSRVKKIGRAWLDQNFEREIDREPFMCRFEYKKKKITIASFHAVPKKKNPASEIKYFKFFPDLYPDTNLVFLGDFNCPQSHNVFDPLKRMQFQPVLIKQKTSLRQKCIGEDCLASEYDNMFYNKSKIKVKGSGVVHFYKQFATMKEALRISDHVPIYGTFYFN